MVLAGLALAPLLAGARGTKRRRLALFGFRNMFSGDDGLDQVAKALAGRGYVDGGLIDLLRVPLVHPDRRESGRGFDYLVPLIEAQLLPVRPEVIVTFGTIMTKGVHLVTQTIPIVANVSDPVAIGVANSLAKPGGNVTGLAGGVAETALKGTEILKALVPKIARLAIFHDQRPMASRYAGHYESAARELGIEPVMHASFEAEGLMQVLRRLPAGSIDAGVISWSPPGMDERAFAREALARRIPLLCSDEQAVEENCLLSYGATGEPVAPRLASIAAQVLDGADPATLPFQFPQTFRLVINRRVAKALGIAVPPASALRADRVID